MYLADRVMTAPDGTKFMDPFDLLENYIQKYDLEEASDEDIFAVIDDWSNFCEAEAVTASLFADGGGGVA